MVLAVPDTNVLVAAMLSNGPSRKMLRLAASKEIQLVSSPELMQELAKVLKRDFGYTEEMCQNALNGLAGILALTEPQIRLDVVKKDPTDNKLLECAKAAKAGYIASYDRHLLEIRQFENTKIATPEAILKDIWKN